MRKTKLNESDLILTLLVQDGSQLRAIAKGARKPTSSFSSRLELYCAAEVLCARGKSLDIVKEVRLIEGFKHLRVDIGRACAAACMAELMERVTQADLSANRLFDLTYAGLSSLDGCDEGHVGLVTAAHLLKGLSLVGLRPSLNACIACGTPVDLDKQTGAIRFSVSEGGVLCGRCSSQVQTTSKSTFELAWVQALIGSPFSAIEAMPVDSFIEQKLLQFCQDWIRVHVGAPPKSLRFLLTSALS